MVIYVEVLLDFAIDAGVPSTQIWQEDLALIFNWLRRQAVRFVSVVVSNVKFPVFVPDFVSKKVIAITDLFEKNRALVPAGDEQDKWLTLPCVWQLVGSWCFKGVVELDLIARTFMLEPKPFLKVTC